MSAGDRFTIEGIARAGGMGTVYRARDGQTGAMVALKLVRGTVEPARLLREAEILGQLDHPHIVRYVARGTRGGEPFLAMEWLDGEDLAERLARAPLSLDETVRLAMRVCDGLAAAHERDVVHRDLKPSNLFLPERSIDR